MPYPIVSAAITALPASVVVLAGVQTSGNMFSRTFYGRYCDTPQAVDGWLEDAVRLTEGLRPGWQAEYAGEEAWYTKLQRSESGACVDFQVSWS